MRNDRLPPGYWIVPALAFGVIFWVIIFQLVAQVLG